MVAVSFIILFCFLFSFFLFLPVLAARRVLRAAGAPDMATSIPAFQVFCNEYEKDRK